MAYYLGIDTSNYTTSAAVYDSATNRIRQRRQLLPVAEGRLGLRQGDAVFLHVRQLGGLLAELMAEESCPLRAVAASAAPRDAEGSYMPCFLVGMMAAEVAASTARLASHTFSHQAGHIAAALYSAGRCDLMKRPFLAFHLSGGTTECLHVQPDAEQILHIETVSQTLDLNAGQAVDRVGGMLGLPFPAGPALEKLAGGSGRQYTPKPAMKGKDCCLSGIENQCARMLQGGEGKADVAQYCLAYISAALTEMTARALEDYPGLPLVYAGGVMANRQIRAAVQSHYTAVFAQPELSSDNAAGTALLCAVKEEGMQLVDRYSQPG